MSNTSYKSVGLEDYLKKLFDHLKSDNIENAYIVMDNARIHKTPDVIQTIEKAGHQAVFLPPWCPFLNPIENLFNQWKGKIRGFQSESETELYENIKKAEAEIQSFHCENYFKNMESYIPLCLERAQIYN